MNDAERAAEKLDKSLVGLRRSSALFTTVAAIIIAVILASGVYTNIRVFQITNELGRTQRSEAAQTVIARRASCLQYNAQEAAQVIAEKVEIRAVVAALTAGDMSPSTVQRVAVFLAGYDLTVDHAHRARDCSPDGIARYLNQKGS